MDKKPNRETMNLIKKQISFLKKEFKPEKIILFGSRARGDNLKESDVDLLIVSKKFEGISLRDRMAEAYGPWNNKIDLEIICYTPEEFEKKSKQIGIVKQAIKEGINL